VGGHRTGDADHGADGRSLPDPRRAGSRLEVFHPGQSRYRAGAVRHHFGVFGGAAGDRAGLAGHGLGSAARPRRRLRSGAAQSGVRVPAARLRHQGRFGAAARLAARRPRRRPHADFGGAVRSVAERRAVRGAAVQDADERQSIRSGAGSVDGRLGACCPCCSPG
jgi:hypothetical protein